MNSMNLIRKMVHMLFALSLIFITSSKINAQYFVKSYDFPIAPGKLEAGFSIERSIVGLESWSLTGVSNSNSPGGVDWMWISLNKNGGIINAFLYSSPGQLNDSCFDHKVFLNGNSTNYAMVGQFRQFNKSNATLLIIDSNGFPLMKKAIDDSCSHTYLGIERTDQNENLGLTGFIDRVTNLGLTTRKILVSNYNYSGNLQWASTFLTSNETSYEEAVSICYQQDDDCYGIVGRTNFRNPVANFQELLIVKYSRTNPNNIFWSKLYRIANNPMAKVEPKKIIDMPDGGFAVIGWTNYNDNLFGNIFLLRVNRDGNPIWCMIYGQQGVTEKGTSLILDSNNSIVFTGSRSNLGQTNAILVKLLPNSPTVQFATRWDKFRNTEFGYDLKEAFSPAGYSVTGLANPIASNSDDPFLMRTDSLGNTTTGCLESFALQQINVNVIIDSIFLTNEPLGDFSLLINSLPQLPIVRNICVITGTGPGNSNTPGEFVLKQNYPNPFNPTTNIGFSIPKNDFIKITLYDILGKEVGILVNEYKEKGSYLISYDASNLTSGIYFYKMQTGEFTDMKKMVIIK